MLANFLVTRPWRECATQQLQPYFYSPRLLCHILENSWHWH